MYIVVSIISHSCKLQRKGGTYNVDKGHCSTNLEFAIKPIKHKVGYSVNSMENYNVPPYTIFYFHTRNVYMNRIHR